MKTTVMKDADVQRQQGRRRALGTLVGVGGGLAMGLAQAGGVGPADTRSRQALLDLALTGEALMVSFYRAALTQATFRMSEVQTGHFGQMLEAELQHQALLQQVGGRVLARQGHVPQGAFVDAGIFVQTGLELEQALTHSYLAATRQFAALGEVNLAALAARLAASEAQHLTQFSAMAGLGTTTDDWTALPQRPALPLAGYLRPTQASVALLLT